MFHCTLERYTPKSWTLLDIPVCCASDIASGPDAVLQRFINLLHGTEPESHDLDTFVDKLVY